MRYILSVIAGAALAAACSSDPECQSNHPGDGQYPGYDYCSGAAYPDFTNPTTRWDGTYPAGCEGVSGEDAFACSEQLFWDVLQFDRAGRPQALTDLRALSDRLETEGGLTPTQMGRLNLRVGQLAVVLVTEDDQSSAGPLLQAYLERAVSHDPGNVMIEAWYYTVLINGAVVLGQDPEMYLEAMWDLYEKDPPTVTGALMGVTSGMALDTGWPDIAVNLVAGIDLDDCGLWCGWEFHRAPWGMPGQSYSYAEVYARVGDREKTLQFLQLTRQSRYYDEWILEPKVEEQIADVDEWIASFATRGSDSDVFDLQIGSSDHACTFCHGPR
jgi:hypothetical protein